jgi:electron transport complex protein RnfA
MKTIIFILVIASFVQMIEMIMKKITPTLYKNLGIYLPLITTNCAVLGIATIVSNYSFLKSLVVSFASGLGFMFVIYIFSTIREKIDNNNIPKNFKGIPIAFITASIMAMIILRFSGV